MAASYTDPLEAERVYQTNTQVQWVSNEPRGDAAMLLVVGLCKRELLYAQRRNTQAVPSDSEHNPSAQKKLTFHHTPESGIPTLHT